jgi:hypothetical protein
MEQEKSKKNLIDTTDCLEAVGVFKGWKNLLFVVILLLLFAIQGSFWVTELGFVKSDSICDGEKTADSAVISDMNKAVDDVEKSEPVAPNSLTAKINQAAKEVIDPDANAPVKTRAENIVKGEKAELSTLPFVIKQNNIRWLVKIVNFILIPSAVLYCLTILFSLKISLIGGLGGINHIARAFFVSLIFVVILLPWQLYFPGVFKGVIFTSSELLNRCMADKNGGVCPYLMYYLRFVAYWIIAFVLLMSAQIKTGRWSRKTLERLEVV